MVTISMGSSSRILRLCCGGLRRRHTHKANIARQQSKAPPHTRLKFDGVAVVRQFLDADDLKSLAQLVETTYKLMSLAQIPDAEMADNFKRWNGVWLQPLPDFLNKSGRFGYAWRFYPQRSFMRRQVGGATVPWHIDADAVELVGFHSTRSVRSCRRWMSSQPPIKNAHAGLDARPRLQRRHLCRFLWFYGDPDTRSGRCVGLRPVHASSHSTLGVVGLHADIVRISFYQDADVAAIACRV